jgi:aromatic-L-amino-acid decarboxylase
LLRGHLHLAGDLADAVEAEPNWTVVAPVELGTVVLRYETGKPEADDQVDHEILANMNASGDAFLTHTVLNGRVVIALPPVI